MEASQIQTHTQALPSKSIVILQYENLVIVGLASIILMNQGCGFAPMDLVYFKYHDYSV